MPRAKGRRAGCRLWAAGAPRAPLPLTASLLAGTGNSFETMDVRFENISNPWSPGARVVQPWLHRQPRRSERQAAFPFGKALPRYLLFYNPHRRNRWGHLRSYRIQHSSHAGRVLPRGWQEEKGISWGRWGGGSPQHQNMAPVGPGGLRLSQPRCLCAEPRALPGRCGQGPGTFPGGTTCPRLPVPTPAAPLQAELVTVTATVTAIPGCRVTSKETPPFLPCYGEQMVASAQGAPRSQI